MRGPQSTVYLEELLETYKLDVYAVALHLFPLNKHPRASIRRVFKGESLLNSDQLYKLASLTGLTISDLYDKDSWIERQPGAVQIFDLGRYEAHLNTNTWETIIFHKNSTYYCNVGVVPQRDITSYFNLINSKISKIDEQINL